MDTKRRCGWMIDRHANIRCEREGAHRQECPQTDEDKPKYRYLCLAHWEDLQLMKYQEKTAGR